MPPQGSSEVVPQQEIVADFTDGQLDRAFAAFAKFTQMLPKDGPVQTSVGEQLETYALYKQATIGPCNTPKPSLMHPILRLMWNAWNKLGNMTKREAKRTYVENFIKRTERNYEKHHKDLPTWMADKKYEDVKAFVKERREDFGITYMHTPHGLKEVSIVGKEIGFEL